MTLSQPVAVERDPAHPASICDMRACGTRCCVGTRRVNLPEPISYARNVVSHLWKILASGWSRLLTGSDAMREDEMDGTNFGQLSMPVTVSPARYVLLPLAQSVTGYTVKAMERKIERGDWQEGKVWRRAPDGHILIDLQGYHRWVENR